MGIGDNIMATGIAKGAKARGKRIAFGDGRRIKWDQHSSFIFQGNPNVAPPGSERFHDLEWFPFYKGSRLYNTQAPGKWVWHPEKFRAKPGEIYFQQSERSFADYHECLNAVIIEPNVPNHKSCAPNKQWSVERFQEVVKYFNGKTKVIQFIYPGARYLLSGVVQVATPSFRHAAACIKMASLAILPEGGLHHAAAATGTKAVVLFGGFIPPSVTGYDSHINLTGGLEACGSLNRCQHCLDAMNNITVDQVLESVEILNGRP